MATQTKAYKVENFSRVEKERDRLDLMLHDVVNGHVVYGAWITENPDAKYRVGISNRAWPIAMLTFRSKGQADSVQVFDLEPWETEVYASRARSDVWEPVLQALLSAKAALRAKAA